ncbi:MAG: hypothetical protein ACI9FR_003284 [Cryomorphaceae bacterium]|jgi:hypothetical protein
MLLITVRVHFSGSIVWADKALPDITMLLSKARLGLLPAALDLLIE